MNGSDDGLVRLLGEYERALAHTDALTVDLTTDQLMWRPNEQSSAIAWHLAHQPAVAYYMVRNLTAASPRLDPELEGLADSATPETERGRLPSPERIREFRTTVADRVRNGIEQIVRGDVGAPAQLAIVARPMLTAIVNHEYQHDVWIDEVRTGALGLPAVELRPSPAIGLVDGYPVLTVA